MTTQPYSRTPTELLREKAMMQTPANWPWAFRLPVKRMKPAKPGDLPFETGLINVGDLLTVHIDRETAGPHTPSSITYASTDAILDDGWVVD